MIRRLSIAVVGFVAIACAEPEPARNLVLVVFDTMRADRLSSYGYPIPTSPHLDTLAAEGVRFETVVSNASWTLPAMAGLFAGDYPTRQVFGFRLNRSVVEKIRAAGIRTAGFVEGGFVSEHFGFDRGFDSFDSFGSVDADGQNDSPVGIEATFAKAEEWLRANHGERFFLVIHTYEPHTPYTRHDYTAGLDSGRLGQTFGPSDARKIRRGELELDPTERTWVRALYDGGIAASDRHLGLLLGSLKELGIRSQTAVVVTSDHGEDLGGREPEWPGTHGQDLYDESLLVPLVIHDPTRSYAVKQVTTQVRTIDVMHTVTELLGLPPTRGLFGRSLVPLMQGTEVAHRAGWSSVPRSKYFDHTKRFSLRTGTHKLIMSSPDSGKIALELYDLASDPGERANVARAEPARRTRLLRGLINLRDGLRRQQLPHYGLSTEEVDPKVQERLRELGVVE